jgi:transcription elongation factor Elf1
MIKIKPTPPPDFNCPFCGATSIEVMNIRIPGMSTLADCRCEVCSQEFNVVLPIGHTSDHYLAVDKQTGKIFKGSQNPEWLNNIIHSTVNTLKTESVTIRKEVFKNTNRVIILNALDYIYGHALLKLLNSYYHLEYQKEFGLIIIIPTVLEWMIPQGCAEAWVVN